MMHSAEEYTLSIRLEHIDGERMYVARVEELPDVEEYADTYDFARELALDTIRTSQKVFAQKGMAFPSPKEFIIKPAVSGRVSLRLPVSLHSKCLEMAEHEGVSLNTYLIDCIRGASSNSNSNIKEMSAKIDLLFEKVDSIHANNAWGHLYMRHAFEKERNVKTYASKVKLIFTEAEEEVPTTRIRNFLSTSLRKSSTC